MCPGKRHEFIRRREILVPESVPRKSARPIRSENRALLVASIARGRRWLEELTTDPAVNTESIAQCEAAAYGRLT